MAKSPQNARWFQVDAEGMAKVFARYKKSTALVELVANAFDADGTTTVSVGLERQRAGSVQISVEDDSPNGFADLMHSYTLFAPSASGAHATKRGKFCVGEKCAISMCREALIESTKGAVKFDREGRHNLTRRRVAGTRFSGVMAMSDEELAEVSAYLRRLIVPAGITLTLNGEVLARREPLTTVAATLDTEIANTEGVLTRTRRATSVSLYKLLDGEEAWLYELGIPVCPLGGQLVVHVDVGQKTPVSLDRTDVPRAFRQAIRTIALNNVHALLSQSEAAAPWVAEALGGKDVTPEAVDSVLTARYGEKRVAFDPSDREANSRAFAAGYTVVTGGSLSGDAWGVVKAFGALPPAGQVFPTNPGEVGDRGTIPEEQWTESMRRLAALSMRIAKRILDIDVSVVFDVAPNGRDAANYARGGATSGRLCFNLGRLGKKWPDQGVTATVLDLLCHELAHSRESNHLDDNYNNALSFIAGRLAIAVRDNPSILEWRDDRSKPLCSVPALASSISLAAPSR